MDGNALDVQCESTARAEQGSVEQSGERKRECSTGSGEGGEGREGEGDAKADGPGGDRERAVSEERGRRGGSRIREASGGDVGEAQPGAGTCDEGERGERIQEGACWKRGERLRSGIVAAGLAEVQLEDGR